MRWYQHRVQGGSFITSLKNRLPSAATSAPIQAQNSQERSRFCRSARVDADR